MHNLEVAPEDSEWVSLMAALENQKNKMADDFLLLLRNIVGYDAEMVSVTDLRATTISATKFLVESLTVGHISDQLIEFATNLGTRRARQGMPLESLMNAVRLDFKLLWAELLAISSPEDASLLASHVESVWRVIDEYAARTRTSYITEQLRMASKQSAYRQEFIARLFDPTGQRPDAVATVATVLEVEAEGFFNIAVASGSGVRALRQWASFVGNSANVSLHQTGDNSIAFWQALPNLGMGPGRPLPRGLETIPCGLIEEVHGLYAVPAAAEKAARLARLLTKSDPGPLTIESGWMRLAKHSVHDLGLDLTEEIEQQLASCTKPERQRLDEAVRHFVRSGSITTTAKALYCHRNTVLNRLRRFQELTGIDLTIPIDAARVIIAWS